MTLASAANHLITSKITRIPRDPSLVLSSSFKLRQILAEDEVQHCQEGARADTQTSVQGSFPHLKQGMKGSILYPFPAIAEETPRRLQTSAHYVES